MFFVFDQLISQPVFDQYRDDELAPGATCDSDGDLNTFIRQRSDSVYHPCGTCRMGSPEKEEKVVVDANCRVVGVNRLRIADASVMPSIVSGKLNAAVIMIAERVSDMILGNKMLPKANIPDWKSHHVAKTN